MLLVTGNTVAQSSASNSGPGSGTDGATTTTREPSSTPLDCSLPSNEFLPPCQSGSGYNPASTTTEGPQSGRFHVEGQIGTNPINNNAPAEPGSGTSAASSPSLSSPQSSSVALSSCSAIQFKSLIDILIWVRCIIGAAIIPLIFGLAFVVFLWGIFRFMAAPAQSKDKEEAKKFILWGIIGLFVMVSIWGIIKIMGKTLGFETGVPYLQTKYLDVNNADKTP